MRTVLIPGLLCDRFCFEPLLAMLSAEVADCTTQDSLTTMAQDVLSAHPGPLQVVGHSMGARVALEVARLAPDRVTRLVLMDTGIHPLRDGEREKRDAITRLAYDEGMQALAERWLPPMVWGPNRADAALMDGLRAMVLRMNPDIHARQIRALVDRPDASAYLGQITCPVLLIVGREDQWSPVSQHEDMLALLPDARLEIVEKAGHFAPVERPDVVAALIADFLEG